MGVLILRLDTLNLHGNVHQEVLVLRVKHLTMPPMMVLISSAARKCLQSNIFNTLSAAKCELFSRSAVLTARIQNQPLQFE